MRIVIANEKGGVGKTATAVTLSYALASLKPQDSILLIDGDERTFSASQWISTGIEAGHQPPFQTVTLDQFDPDQHEADHLVLDTKAGEGENELLNLAASFDLLVIPSKPDALSLRALILTLRPLLEAGVSNYRVLLTDVPPAPSTNGHDARLSLMESGIPLFTQDIRRASALEKAALEGICVRDIKKDGRAKLVWMDYSVVAREVMS